MLLITDKHCLWRGGSVRGEKAWQAWLDVEAVAVSGAELSVWRPLVQRLRVVAWPLRREKRAKSYSLRQNGGMCQR